MSHTIYGPGGYDPAKPNSNVLLWADDATRTVTDYRTTPATTRPYTAAENADADEQALQASLASMEQRVAAIETRLGTLGGIVDPTAPVPAWAAGQAVKVGDLRSYGGTVYRCLQAHTTQAGWEPPNVPALWTVA